jgi:hypothetical protein
MSHAAMRTIAAISAACAGITLLTLVLWERHIIGSYWAAGVDSLLIVVYIILATTFFREFYSS